jgi:endonuclease/exonuclease/phosphatase (EEP) superfamily protein YafD
MIEAFAIATAILLAVTVLPLWNNPHWSVRGMDFPRLQFALLAIVLLTAQLGLLDLGDGISWILVGTTFACLCRQAWWILPYTPLWPSEVEACLDQDPQRRLRVLTANVLTPNRNSDALIALVRQNRPDVLVTLESDGWWQERLDVLSDDMPHSIKCPLDNLYGMHVYSRLPLIDAEISYLVEEDVPSMHALVTLRNGDNVRMHFLHPAPPSPTENEKSEERDAELVIVARSVADSDEAIIVTGDLNDVAWSSTTRLFRKISGLMDPRIGRGLFNTFHADYPVLRWPLDHLFHSRHFTLVSIRRLHSIGSDHFPLLTELALTPVQGESQQGLEATVADQERADSIADTQNVDKSDVPRPGE